MERFNIMWTGGLDSTYTMVIYSRELIEIQPYYFRNGRKSEKYEMAAMQYMIESLKSNPATKANILPIKVVNPEDIPNDEEVDRAYQKIKSAGGLGSQYNWIARYVKNSSVDGLFYSPVKPLGYVSKLRKCFEANGGLEEKVNSVGHTYFTINKEKGTDELKMLFGKFYMSETFLITKIEEEKRLREMGYGDIVDRTWVCHTPVMGRPCGCCTPCTDAIDVGQTWRFTPSQLKRHEQLKAGVPAWKVRLGSYIDAVFNR